MAEVALAAVSKEFGGVAAVKALSLTVADGEFLVLVGPSGCGKTTTLRMIAGLETPDAGEIRIGGRVVNDVPPKERDIAMVFQSYALYPHMTVFENMAFGLRLRGTPRAEVEGRVQETARLLGMEALLDRRPRELSGGERQRVAVGRAIVRRPAAFLLDEPLSNLDARLRVEMRAELGRLHRRLGSTMVYVTHDQVEAMTLGGRIAVMNKGVAHQVAPPLEVYDRPADRFVAGFIGSPPMNLLEGALAREGERTVFRRGGLQLALPPEMAVRSVSAVVLGVRPEHVRFATGGVATAAVATPARINAVELLGDQKIGHLLVGADAIVAKWDAHVPVVVGETILVAFDLGRAHLFDAQTGVRLTP